MKRRIGLAVPEIKDRTRACLCVVAEILGRAPQLLHFDDGQPEPCRCPAHLRKTLRIIFRLRKRICDHIGRSQPVLTAQNLCLIAHILLQCVKLILVLRAERHRQLTAPGRDAEVLRADIDVDDRTENHALVRLREQRI